MSGPTRSDNKSMWPSTMRRKKIQLDPAKIEKSPGLRTLAKMMVNSICGKIGQKPNKKQGKEFDDPIKFHEFHDSDKYDPQTKCERRHIITTGHGCTSNRGTQTVSHCSSSKRVRHCDQEIPDGLYKTRD